jgi:hypothetical protein
MSLSVGTLSARKLCLKTSNRGAYRRSSAYKLSLCAWANLSAMLFWPIERKYGMTTSIGGWFDR